jgi:ureidoglycolate lyase
MPEQLILRPLTREAFAPFGDVIELDGAQSFPINQGTTIRYHDLARVVTQGPGAKAQINLFRAMPFELPIFIAMMERHPLGSQAFIALHARPWLVVVAPDKDGVPGEPRAFLLRGEPDRLGVNYAPGVWHHPLIALEDESDFLVVDRGGEGSNLEEADYLRPYSIESL